MAELYKNLIAKNQLKSLQPVRTGYAFLFDE